MEVKLISYSQPLKEDIFNEVTINDYMIDQEDWVAAFNGDVCVGARQWDIEACGGGICEVPAYGYDGSDGTSDYLN